MWEEESCLLGNDIERCALILFLLCALLPSGSCMQVFRATVQQRYAMIFVYLIWCIEQLHRVFLFFLIMLMHCTALGKRKFGLSISVKTQT